MTECGNCNFTYSLSIALNEMRGKSECVSEIDDMGIYITDSLVIVINRSIVSIVYISHYGNLLRTEYYIGDLMDNLHSEYLIGILFGMDPVQRTGRIEYWR